jgi:hypothetical protein
MNLNAVAVDMARRIEIWPIDRLKPYARNARTHSDEQVAQIAASIVEFGFCNPVLVDTNEGIVAGHGRLLAARKLRLAECPVVVLDHLTEEKLWNLFLDVRTLLRLLGLREQLVVLGIGEANRAEIGVRSDG